MQTFLPTSDYKECAAMLDRLRLGKQRVEGYQILRTLLGLSQGWKNHPCVKMWKGYEGELKKYTLDMCREWINRGYNDTLMEKIAAMETPNTVAPPWITEELCASHRSNLLRKKPEYYKTFGWTEPDNLPYLWPVK